MQEQVNEKTIALYIKTGKLTADTLQKAMKSLLSQMKKQKDKQPHGKQTLKQLMKQNTGVSKTAKSILISCGARLAPFDIRELRELMETDEMELDTIGDRKTALFVIISDTDDTFNFVVSILYTQLFNLLCDKADDVYGGRLPVHVRCLLDEFANIGQIPKFEKLIATIRSREISASIILQSQSQLKAIYKDNADTIVGNCDTTLFLGGKEKTTLKEMSELLGKETIDSFNTSETRSNQKSYGLNYQKLGKELMSQDEIAVMDGGKCILQLRGVEKDNSGVEGAHKTEEAAERGARYGARKLREGYRSHKLKPYRAAAQAEKAAAKANVEFQYQKLLHDNPQIAASNPLSRYWQKQQIKKQYAKAARTGGAKTAKTAAENTKKAAKKSAEAAKKTAQFTARHWKGILIAIAALLLFIMIAAGVSSCASMFSGVLNGVLGTSYTSEDSDLVATENNYAAMEADLQRQIDNIERDYPGYDEYRYDLDNIGHNPHELASYLTALLQSYTPQSAQAELNRVFDMQYTLTVTEEIEIRYRTETRTGSYTVTDPETGETTTETYEYEVEVPYEYYILNVSLTNRDIVSFAPEVLNAEQLEMFRVYLETSGNKPLLFGGGSADTSASEDLSGVQFVNGTRSGNSELVELAKGQVGNVGGAPYWSWYGFDYRVEWCACFVSWCYGQAGLSEPRFAACQSQGIPWFTSHGQWGARGYENIAPGDAIFFDWDLDGSADHVGLVIGTDGSRVYTVEGNSGDACKIKSYSLDYACIKGYGLMNWD